jgi:hypothetical protein
MPYSKKYGTRQVVSQSDHFLDLRFSQQWYHLLGYNAL